MNSESSDNTHRPATRTKYPLGLVVILIVLGFGIASMLWNLADPGIVIGTWFLGSTTALVYLIFGLIIQGLALYGILKSKEWGRKVCIVWQTYRLAVGVVLVRAALFDKDGLLAAHDKMTPGFRNVALTSDYLFPIMVLGAVLMMLISATIIVYLWLKKEHFSG